MIKTDYQEISKTYDNNKYRHYIPKDAIISKLGSTKIRILDLGCGTGNYLQKQQEFYPESNLEWFGVDLSADMLKLAKTKTENTTFYENSEEQINFEENYFDYIICNFAFHHFENKYLVLDLIFRSLKNNGIFKYKNIFTEIMKNWWVYKYVPETKFMRNRITPRNRCLYSRPRGAIP